MELILLEARGLARAPCLANVSLALRRRELAAILGPPGAGKSTLLRLLAFRERPDAGLLLWQGRLVEAGEVLPIRLVSGSEPPGVSPELLLADEPAPAALPALLRFHRNGCTLLIATADPETAIICPTIYALNQGRLQRLNRTTF